MPFKRPKTPYYICRVKNLPGYGYSGELKGAQHLNSAHIVDVNKRHGNDE